MIQSIFIGPNGLRAGWRFVLFIALLAGLSIPPDRIMTHLSGYKPSETWNPVDFILSEGTHFIVALIAVAILMRIERRRWPFSSYGLDWNSSSLRLFLQGSLFGLLAPSLVMILIFAAGGVRFAGLASAANSLIMPAILWLIAMTLLGLTEEYLFRGYPLFTLSTGIGFWLSAILLSLVFGGLHYFLKPMETRVDGLSVTLIGLFLCFTFKRTGSLWFAIGFHALFDYAALIIYAAPNTGNQGQPVEGSLLKTIFHGSQWVTGGPCGIEASAFIFPVLIALVFVFTRLYKQAPNSPLQKLGS